jgi:hypothetical protein
MSSGLLVRLDSRTEPGAGARGRACCTAGPLQIRFRNFGESGRGTFAGQVPVTGHGLSGADKWLDYGVTKKVPPALNFSRRILNSEVVSGKRQSALLRARRAKSPWGARSSPESNMACEFGSLSGIPVRVRFVVTGGSPVLLKNRRAACNCGFSPRRDSLTTLNRNRGRFVHSRSSPGRESTPPRREIDPHDPCPAPGGGLIFERQRNVNRLDRGGRIA